MAAQLIGRHSPVNKSRRPTVVAAVERSPGASTVAEDRAAVGGRRGSRLGRGCISPVIAAIVAGCGAAVVVVVFVVHVAAEVVVGGSCTSSTDKDVDGAEDALAEPSREVDASCVALLRLPLVLSVVDAGDGSGSVGRSRPDMVLV